VLFDSRTSSCCYFFEKMPSAPQGGCGFVWGGGGLFVVGWWWGRAARVGMRMEHVQRFFFSPHRCFSPKIPPIGSPPQGTSNPTLFPLSVLFFLPLHILRNAGSHTLQCRDGAPNMQALSQHMFSIPPAFSCVGETGITCRRPTSPGIFSASRKLSFFCRL